MGKTGKGNKDKDKGTVYVPAEEEEGKMGGAAAEVNIPLLGSVKLTTPVVGVLGGVSLFGILITAAVLAALALGLYATVKVNDMDDDIDRIDEAINKVGIPDYYPAELYYDDDDEGIDDDDAQGDYALRNLKVIDSLRVVSGDVYVRNGDFTARNGQVTSNCTNDHELLTISTTSPAIEAGNVVGLWESYGYLGFDSFPASAGERTGDQLSAQVIEIDATHAVAVYLNFDLTELRATFVTTDATTKAITAVSPSIDFAQQVIIVFDFFFDCDRHENSPNSIVCVYDNPTTFNDGLIARSAVVSGYTTPTVTFSEEVIETGNTICPSRWKWAFNNFFLLSFVEFGVGLYVKTVEIDLAPLVDVYTEHASVLLDATFTDDDDECRTVSGETDGQDFCLTYGGGGVSGSSVSSRCGSIDGAGTITVSGAVVINTNVDAMHDSTLIGSGRQQVVTFIEPFTDDETGSINMYFRSSASAGAAITLVGAVSHEYSNIPPDASVDQLETIGRVFRSPSKNEVALTFPVYGFGAGRSQIVQIWNVDNPATDLFAGDQTVISHVYNDHVSLAWLDDNNLMSLSSNNQVARTDAPINIAFAPLIVTSPDSMNILPGRVVDLVRTKPAAPYCIALHDAEPGEPLLCMVRGCFEDSDAFHFNAPNRLCTLGSGALTYRANAAAGVGGDLYASQCPCMATGSHSIRCGELWNGNYDGPAR